GILAARSRPQHEHGTGSQQAGPAGVLCGRGFRDDIRALNRAPDRVGRARWFRITGLTAGAARMGPARDGGLVDEDEVDGPRLQVCAGNLDLDAVAETVCLSRLASDQSVG